MNLLMQLIQVAMGLRDSLPSVPTEEEWRVLQKRCELHRLIGMGYVAMSRLPAAQQPSRQLRMEWGIHAETVRQYNLEMDTLSRQAYNRYVSESHPGCVLKGQGNAVNYPPEWAAYRQAGDVDLWLRCSVGEALALVGKDMGPEGPRYNHVACARRVELHYRPSFLCNPFYNRRCQQWFAQYDMARNCIEYKGFRIPDNEFNVIYQTMHLFRHLFDGDLRWRLIIDYVYVLRNLPRDIDMASLRHQLDRLGLLGFASGLMWVVEELDPSVPVLCLSNRRKGNLLLAALDREGSSQGFARRNFTKTVNDLRLIWQYPSEALCEPFFRLWHAYWRRNVRRAYGVPNR